MQIERVCRRGDGKNRASRSPSTGHHRRRQQSHRHPVSLRSSQISHLSSRRRRAVVNDSGECRCYVFFVVLLLLFCCLRSSEIEFRRSKNKTSESIGNNSRSVGGNLRKKKKNLQTEGKERCQIDNRQFALFYEVENIHANHRGQEGQPFSNSLNYQ